MVALVQAVGPTTATSLTTLNVTIAATGTGNALVICCMSGASGNNPTISGITLGGSSAGWVSVVNNTAEVPVQVWWNPAAASGQTAIVITCSGGTNTGLLCAYTYEVSGLTGTVDKTANNDSTSGGSPATASSGATSTTTAPNEFWVGLAAAYNSAGAQSFTPIGSWTNGTQGAQSTGSDLYLQTISGYQIVSAEAAATYSATVTCLGWGAAVATFPGTSAAVTGPPLNQGLLPNFPAIITSNAGWRNAGHSR